MPPLFGICPRHRKMRFPFHVSVSIGVYFSFLWFLGCPHLSMSQLDPSMTVAPTSISTVKNANEVTTQVPKSSASASQLTTTSEKNSIASASVPPVSSSSQQTLATTQVLPSSSPESATGTKSSPASSQVTSPTSPTPTSGAPKLTHTASSSVASSYPSPPKSSQGTSPSPNNVTSPVTDGMTTGPTDKTLTSPKASVSKNTTLIPSISVGQTGGTTPPLTKSTVMSSAPDGNTVTPSLVINTTATPPQNTTRTRESAASVKTVETSPTATPNATSISTTISEKPGSPGTSPAAVEPVSSPTSSIKVTCVPHNLSDPSVIILVQVHPRPCKFSMQPIEKGLAEMLCQKVKSTFNPSRDQCTVRLGYSEDPATKLGILGVSVETNSVADELYETLDGKRDKLREFGFSAVNHTSSKNIGGNEDWLSMPLIITIVCMAVSLLLIAAIYGCWHQRQSTRKDQRLTEELQTMENGYHDNPTLDVMETSPEMQEKKTGLNGELGDSWIVPMDHLSKEDMEEEEDTHL
ncbi:podocalyxin isoform X2 [Microcaecilia unicolor]|uniref:Podocalyxin n=1 Tax=Microcaecilia unicolor TaxID=1415580 RepID=A0A6P7Z3B4_9AMPH|nr:podocalyxin isoform X2 [Microcaecilia unicolor]